MMTITAPTDSIPSDPNAFRAIQRTIRRRAVREVTQHIAEGCANVVPGMEGDVIAEAARLGVGSYWTGSAMHPGVESGQRNLDELRAKTAREYDAVCDE